MTPEQLEEWIALPDYQVSLKKLTATPPAGLGISLQDIAGAELAGVVPSHSLLMIALPEVQVVVERLSRARLADAIDRLVDLLTPLASTLAGLEKALQRSSQPPRPAPQAPARPKL